MHSWTSVAWAFCAILWFVVSLIRAVPLKDKEGSRFAFLVAVGMMILSSAT
jgi:hypothetical protein